VIKLRRARAGHVEHRDNKKNACRLLVRKTRGQRTLKGVGLDVSIIIKSVFKELYEAM
jgi:hypothetical protein